MPVHPQEWSGTFGSSNQGGKFALSAESAAARSEQEVVRALTQLLFKQMACADHGLQHFVLTQTEMEQIIGQMVHEFAQRIPDIMRCMALSALLPIIQRRARAYYLGKGVPGPDVDDLSSTLVEKILKSLFGGWPSGNLGAWVAEIRKNVCQDYWRRVQREARLGKRQAAAALSIHADPGARREALERCIRELPDETRMIVERRRAGEEWAVIAMSLGISLAEVQDMVQRELPGGSSPRRKRRRKRSS